MATTDSDISVVLSGGTTNINPNRSIGGLPSATPIVSGSIDNLFDDISGEESDDGHEDYRCVYVFNDGDTPIYNVSLWVEGPSGDTEIEIGIEDKDEIQRVTVLGVPTGGTLSLGYGGYTAEAAYDADLAVWATSLEESLAEMGESGEPLFRSVSVLGQSGGSGVVIFDILFEGLDGSRSHPEFTDESSLTPGTVTVTVTTPRPGSPINTSAPDIGLETTPPGGVGFFVASEESPILLPKLVPADGFPIWVKRVVPAGTAAAEEEGFVLRFTAESLEPTS